MFSKSFHVLKLCVQKITMRSAMDNYLKTFPVSAREIHITSNIYGKSNDRSLQRRLMPKIDEGTEGENFFELGSYDDIFPDENTPNRVYNGVLYKNLPICNIRVSKNNTIFSITDANGLVKLIYSCGIEGFKNARKGTNIAAQSTGQRFGIKALAAGYKTVRVRIQGLGPGRMSSLKGLEMAGLNMVSVTDATRISWHPPRPPKPRRI